ncbi:uncharacterized protein METZ01_LOCUS31898 [marine metagenome]|uniref:Uncharacterized protein n=1 Tax=marine metagenome TaxID=408172 RepID=A0A381QJG5_9ZZZZ
MKCSPLGVAGPKVGGVARAGGG